MADPVREEADRFFSSHDHSSTHPEDRDNLSDQSEQEDEKAAQHTTEDQGSDDDNDNMATITAARSNYHIPTNTEYANTGPKGVIADAQSFARAKQSTFRSRLAKFTNNTPFKNPTVTETKASKAKSTSSDSDVNLSDESDSDFMNTWRQNRMTELNANQAQSQRRVSPSRRTWGTLSSVDATGYLDAIEKAPSEAIVVVLIYESGSERSHAVEDELGMLAYKYSKTRFVKLDQEIAEMESVDVPAVIAYKGGEVFATISGAKPDGLEDALRTHGVLPS